MIYDQAFEIASDYTAVSGIIHYGCVNNYIITDTNIKDLFMLGPNFPGGVRSKVWQFNFACYEPKPNTVVSGGVVVVVVDDETGQCDSRVAI